MQFYSKNGHFAFLSLDPFGRLRPREATYVAHLRLIGKSVVDFPLVITFFH